MTPKEFNIVLQNTLDSCSKLLASKSKEYDFNTDRLHSFKAGAQLLGNTSIDTLLGYLTKHIMSVFDMSKEFDNFPMEKWDEKLLDCINYFILLRALLIDEKNILVREYFDTNKNKKSVAETLEENGMFLKGEQDE